MQAISYFKRNQTLAILSSQTALIAMGVGAINPILPQYAKSFGVSITLIGLVITSFGITRILSDIPTSRLTTRFGRRPILIIGSIVLAISTLCATLLNSYWGLLVAWAIQGMGASLFMVSAMIMLVDISPAENRGQVMATFQGMQLIGSGIGPVMGGFVAQAWGYRSVFIVFTILTFLCFLISYFRLPETRDNRKAFADSQGQQLSKMRMPATQSGIRPLLLDVRFVLISLISLGVVMMRAVAQNQILPLLGQDRMGLSSGQIGIAMTVTVIFQFTAMFIGGRLSDRFGRKTIIIPGGVIGALSLVALSQSYNFETLLLSCIGMGIGVGMAGSTALAYVADITPRGNYDASMGLYRTITDLSFVFGPVLLGWLADVGGFSLSLLFNAAFLFILVITFQIFARRRPKIS